MGGAVPVEGALQTFFQADGGFVAEDSAGVGDVGLRVANVTIAWRVMARFEGLARDFAQGRDNFVQVDARSCADVEDSSGSAGSFTGKQVGLHSVVNVGEIAGLRAVAKNDRLGFFQECGAEFCQYS